MKMANTWMDMVKKVLRKIQKGHFAIMTVVTGTGVREGMTGVQEEMTVARAEMAVVAADQVVETAVREDKR
jgi:hypothetical protein